MGGHLPAPSPIAIGQSQLAAITTELGACELRACSPNWERPRPRARGGGLTGGKREQWGFDDETA